MPIAHKRNYSNELLYCLLSGFISLIAAYFFLGLSGVDMRVPFVYSGDNFTGLTVAQNFITGNGRFIYPNMGLPEMANSAGWPDAAHLDYIGLWLLSLVIKEAGQLINVFFISTFVTVSIAATISFRLLKLNPLLSVSGGVLYTLLPYHFYRGDAGHIFLTPYAVVPLGCVLLIWVMDGQLVIKREQKKNEAGGSRLRALFTGKFIFAICLAVYIGLSFLYYAFFICLGLAFVIMWNFIKERRIRNIIAPIAILVTVVVTVIIGLIPHILYIAEGNLSTLEGTRGYRDVEIFALRVAQLVLPVFGHRIPLLAKVREFYENSASVVPRNESFASALGIYMSIGLVVSFFVATKKDTTAVKIDSSVKNSAILNIAVVLLGTMGGIASLIGLLIPQMRAYNRLSIFVAFFSLYIIMYITDLILHRLKRYYVVAITLCICSVALFDMVPANCKILQHHKVIYYEHKDFFAELERITPANSMVFQLPFVPSSIHTRYMEIGIYEQFIPFVHTKTIKWSYRAMIGSSAEKWQRAVTRMPVEEMLKHLAGAGFTGVYINRAGYTQSDFEKLDSEIKQITGVEPLISRDAKMEYFYLGEYTESLLASLTAPEVAEYTDWKSIANNNIPEISMQNAPTINGVRDENGLVSNGVEGYLMYGPYASLPPGKYLLTLECELLNPEDAPDTIGHSDFVYNHGSNSLGYENIRKSDFKDGQLTLEYPIFVYEDINDFEFRFYTYNGVVLRIANPEIKEND